MGGNRGIASNLALAVLLTAALPCAAQYQSRSVRQHRVPVEETGASAIVRKAEAALERKDYAAAEQLLRSAVAADAKDHAAWYYLGFVLNATERRGEAIDAYRKSVAAKTDVFESTLNLGLLLAAEGHPDAARFLRAATRLKPVSNPQDGLSRAWLALGRVQENSDPDEALRGFVEAARLRPADAEPRLATARLLQAQKRWAEAEKAFAEAAEIDPASQEAISGLAEVYLGMQRHADAERMLRRYLALQPGEAGAHVQLARVLQAQGKSEAAAAELEMALKLSPGNRDALQELAEIYDASKNHERSAAVYRQLLEKAPDDALLHHRLGRALLQQRDFPAAEAEFMTAVKLKPDFADAYLDLGMAASQQQKHELTVRALDERAKFASEIPLTYFLRATAYDHLKIFKQAADNYRQFLAAANGQFPDQEWQARHRLIAIEPRR